VDTCNAKMFTMTFRTFSCSLSALLIIASAGCSDSTPSDTRSVPTERGSQSAAAPQNRAELTNDLLNAYERGLRREIEAVRAAQERSSNAKTPQERGEAIQGSFEHATIPQGAVAAGLPVEQYRAVRETIHTVLETLDFQGKIDGPLSMDLSRADEATKQRLARDPFTELSSASAATLRAQINRLVPVWVEYINLTAVAG
jgi:hypothetical protein